MTKEYGNTSMKRMLFAEAEDIIATAIESVFTRLDDHTTGWRDVACNVAMDLIEGIVKDNEPRLWEACLNEGTEYEEHYICGDGSRVAPLECTHNGVKDAVWCSKCGLKPENAPARCKQCNDRVPRQDTFCSDECEEGYNLALGEQARLAVKRGLEEKLTARETASKFIPAEIQQMIDQGLVKDCTEEQGENIPAFIAHSEKTTEPLVGLYKNDDRWEILLGIDGRASYDYDSVAEAVLGFKNQLEYWLAAEAREQIHLRLFGEPR